MIIVADPQRVDADLAAGQLGCPHCGGRLRAWAYARERRVRVLRADPVIVRPRRARCAACSRTQVLLPGACLPRRADATEVVEAALLAMASGRGHRRIAADLHRSPSTVRRWLRAVRGPRAVELWHQVVPLLVRLDQDAITRLHRRWHHRPPGELRQALDAFGAYVHAVRTRFSDLRVGAWPLIGTVTAPTRPQNAVTMPTRTDTGDHSRRHDADDRVTMPTNLPPQTSPIVTTSASLTTPSSARSTTANS